MRVVALAALVVLAACEPPEVTVDTDPLSSLPKFEEQRQALCARGRDNAVTRAVCGARAPDITSLVELQQAVGMAFPRSDADPPARPGFALTANSSALSARSVSAINPRAILVQRPAQRSDGNFMSLGYVRGEHAVELAVRNPAGETSLYLVVYEQACHERAAEGGAPCTFEEMLTPLTESGWTRWSIYDDEDLKNTILDCRQCHQPDGPGTRVDFRMQEFANPWTHWMAAFGEGERALFRDYVNAHGPDEDYAGIPARFVMTEGNPILVQNFFEASGSVEPNPFPSEVIEEEVKDSAPGQPVDNSVPGTSPTWEALYERAVRGEVFPPPYHDVKITDPARLSLMTGAYVGWRDGTSSEPLPDVRDVIREDALAKLSFRPKPGLTGREILVHACAQCHNDRLDQSLTRARFNALDLDDVPREVKDEAIRRLLRAPEDRFRMPPRLFRDLSEDEIDLAIEELER